MSIPLSGSGGNLYRFTAACGLLLVVVGVVTPVFVENKRQDAIAQKRAESESRVKDRLFKLSDTILREDIKGDEQRRYALDVALRGMETMFQNERAHYQSEIDAGNEAHERHLVILAAVRVVGVIIALTGFCLWWTRVQKYQDVLLREEAERHGAGTKPKVDRPI